MTDTNGAWNYFQALKFLQAVREYDLYLAEQPVPRWDIDGMARLRRKVEMPIFADESAAEIHDLMKLVQKFTTPGKQPVVLTL